jgi:cobalt-zinc-cadmium efflux system outer membrane protein
MESYGKARVAFVTALFATSVVPAAGALTEAEATRIFLEQSPQARRASVIERAAEAELRSHAVVANPGVAYHVEEAAGVRDEFLTVEQELPITGRRGLLRERAEVAASVAGLAARRDLQSDAHELRRSFFEVLYRERVLEALRDEEDLLARTLEILEAREREGEGSGYDVLRAEQELGEHRGEVARARANLSAARARFGSFFDPALLMSAAELAGDLTPVDPLPETEQATLEALELRLDLRSLAAERERLELEQRAARRERFPEPVLTAGWKRTESLGLSDTGYVAAVIVPLPIFDRGRAEHARASAEAERVELDTLVLSRRIRAEVQAAVERERAARQAVELYGEGAERRAAELSRIARLRYEEGESGVLELLDAHRTSLAIRLRALAARYDARLARIERDRVIGREVEP